ncbi:MAG: DUF2282 domain-containing protein [Gammaproteobacteria bacterium]
MNQRHVLIAAALATLWSGAGAADHAADSAQEREKCYGAPKGGRNEFASAIHGCSAKAKTAAKASEEWTWVAKGTCEKVGGKTAPPAKPLSSAPAPQRTGPGGDS